MNSTPEEEVEKAIAPLLAKGWRVISAGTTLAPHGNLPKLDNGRAIFFNTAHHVYFVSTIVMER